MNLEPPHAEAGRVEDLHTDVAKAQLAVGEPQSHALICALAPGYAVVMTFSRAVLTIPLATVALLACAGDPDDAGNGTPDEPSFEELRADVDRNTDPDPTPEELGAIRERGEGFALELFELIGETQPGNVAISPYSIRSAFGMLHAAARGQTEIEIRDALGFLEDQSRTHNAMNYLDLALQSRNHPNDEDPEDSVIVATANQMFARPDMAIGNGYLATLALNYGAGVFIEDFAAHPEKSRGRMNAWVSARTRERIPELFPANSIEANTVWVLVNAIYLKAPWAAKFDTAGTEDRPFTLLDGSEVNVATMSDGFVKGWYGEGDGYQILELPLEYDELGFVVLLPSPGRYLEIEASLRAGLLDEMLEGLPFDKIDTQLPRLTIDSGPQLLNEHLQSLGMVTPFAGADFSGFYDEGQGIGTDIALVYHRVFLGVDESGVEAAAVTGIVGEESGPLASVHANRPFLFFLRDRPTSEILFMGRVMDPR